MPSRPISPAMLDEAKQRAASMGVLSQSFTKGEGSIAGFLGESLANQILCGTMVGDESYEYDILADGVRWDVKTKLTSCQPKADYDVSVSYYQQTQECDRYCFCRVRDDYTEGWVLGWMKKRDFFQKARFYEKGWIDPSNGFEVRETCYSLAISQLNSF